MHRKTKVEIVIDASASDELLERIEAAGAKGYTVVAEVRGRGHRGVRRGDDIFGSFQNVLVIVVAPENVAARIVRETAALLERHAGIVYTSEVQVVRDDHF